MVKQPENEIQTWNVEKLVFYARNPRKNDAAVDLPRTFPAGV